MRFFGSQSINFHILPKLYERTFCGENMKKIKKKGRKSNFSYPNSMVREAGLEPASRAQTRCGTMNCVFVSSLSVVQKLAPSAFSAHIVGFKTHLLLKLEECDLGLLTVFAVSPVPTAVEATTDEKRLHDLDI